MDDRRFLQALFALSVALVLLLSMLPAFSAPPEVLIKPVAVCDKGKCVMEEKDFKTLKEWHEQKHREIVFANTALEEARQEIMALMNMLARYAGGCGGRST